MIGRYDIGRYCQLQGEREERDLRYGMDFRLPQHRREVFLRFYEFHLRYRSHPGCVYYLLPHLAQRENWAMEERLWFAFINGNTQNPVTSWLIFRRFPSLKELDLAKLREWFQANYDRLAFDTDRRYHKAKFLEAVENYVRLTERQQGQFFSFFRYAGRPEKTFRALWTTVNKKFIYFGRLSTFSYLEYLRVMGLEVDCDQLFLEDMSGSKSHRNGLCKVLGRDDLDWHDSNPTFEGRYSKQMLEWLAGEAAILRQEARARFADRDFARDVGYFTIESTLCTYKSWHRPNRRYPNVYNDMLVERIQVAEKAWGEVLDVFWQARQAVLPKHLRLEDNPHDCGVQPKKQNHYRLTGQVIMMDRDWPCFRNDFNDEVRRLQGDI